MFEPVMSVCTCAGNPINEDRAFSVILTLVPVGRIHIYAVIDGHGGPQCATFVHENLEAHFTVAFTRAFDESGGQRTQDSLVCGTLRETFRTVDEAFRSTPHPFVTSGACVVMACLCNGRIYTAGVGDCRAVVGSVTSDGVLEATGLTVDQNCRNDTECDRVRRRSKDPMPFRAASRSRVGSLSRVAGTLAVTRAIGDAYLKEPGIHRFGCNGCERIPSRVPHPAAHFYRRAFNPYITARPVCTTHRLHRRDRYLVLASDGLFDWKSNTEVVEDVHAVLSVPDIESLSAAESVVERALTDKVAPLHRLDYASLAALSPERRRRFHDDITVIVVLLNHHGETGSEEEDEPEDRQAKRPCLDVDAVADEDL